MNKTNPNSNPNHYGFTPSETHKFNFETLMAFFSLISGAAGIYFIFRWGVTLGKVDEKTRELLLGETLASKLTDITLIQTFASVYIGYLFLMFLIKAAGWKGYLEQNRLKLKHYA